MSIQVLNLLYEIDFIYELKSDKLLPYKVYHISIKHKDKEQVFEYSSSLNDLKKESVLKSLLFDYFSFENCKDIHDFQNEFEYQYLSDCLLHYWRCEANYKKLNRIFTYAEIDLLNGIFC